MARPTTRFGRWWACRQKHLAKYRRQQGRKYQKDRSEGKPDRPHNPPYVLQKKGKQAPPRISKELFAQDLRKVYPLLVGPHWTMARPGYANPPRPRLTEAFRAGQEEWRYAHSATVHMWAKPITLLGRKIGHKGGQWHIRFQQDVFFFLNAYYADDDALGRHPTLADYDESGEFVPAAGIWPRGG